jgi:hypothetical protein
MSTRRKLLRSECYACTRASFVFNKLSASSNISSLLQALNMQHNNILKSLNSVHHFTLQRSHEAAPHVSSAPYLRRRLKYPFVLSVAPARLCQQVTRLPGEQIKPLFDLKLRMSLRGHAATCEQVPHRVRGLRHLPSQPPQERGVGRISDMRAQPTEEPGHGCHCSQCKAYGESAICHHNSVGYRCKQYRA